MTTPRRYPLEPLMRLTGWSLNRICRIAPCNGDEYRLRRDKGVTDRTADRLAVTAGLNPYMVWPELLTDQIEDCSRRCDECEEPFVPFRRSQRFCSKSCRQRQLQREWKRRRYQTDPEFAEARRQERRAYYAACGDYERARQRRYDRARRSGDNERVA